MSFFGRWGRALAVGVLLGLGGGCAGEPQGEPWEPSAATQPAGTRWAEEVAVDRETGKLSAPGFNELIDAERPGWADSPRTAASELLDLDRPFDGPVKILMAVENEDVTVTLTGLGDDSIEAERYRVAFERGGDGLYRFVSGEWGQRCQEGRGHQSFAARTCS